MDFHQWQQQLREALRRERVSQSYAQRFIEELTDHYQDLQEAETMDGKPVNEEAWNERLGTPSELASQAAEVPHTTWAGRHPWLGFVILAPALTAALVVLSVVVLALMIVPFAAGKTLQTDPWLSPVMLVLGPLHVIIPALIASILICRSVDRSGRTAWWGIAGCGLIAILCAMTIVRWAAPAVTPGTGSLSVGFGFPFGVFWLQSLVPISIGLIYAAMRLRRRRPNKNHETSPPVRAAA
jgi:hypothetical protein